ncbi:MAG: hypothetical protein J1F64_02185 [Oscillospiraceae bacterium]|nr:hypothetical protein [Oscillospiraceae bacterium]
MVIFNNLKANNANRVSSNINKKTAAVLEKLSSGMRINRAADDAAGLSISEKMRAELSALKEVINIEDNAINMCNVGDGALQEDHNMLGRIMYLLEQAKDDIMSEEDLNAIQQEVNQLVQQIDDIANSVNLNGIYMLLNGSSKSSGSSGAVGGSGSVSPDDDSDVRSVMKQISDALTPGGELDSTGFPKNGNPFTSGAANYFHPESVTLADGTTLSFIDALNSIGRLSLTFSNGKTFDISFSEATKLTKSASGAALTGLSSYGGGYDAATNSFTYAYRVSGSATSNQIEGNKYLKDLTFTVTAKYTVLDDGSCKYDISFNLKTPDDLDLDITDIDLMFQMNTGDGSGEKYYADGNEITDSQMVNSSVSVTTSDMDSVGISEEIDRGNADYVAVGDYKDITNWDHYQDAHNGSGSALQSSDLSGNGGVTLVWKNKSLSKDNHSLEIGRFSFIIKPQSADPNIPAGGSGGGTGNTGSTPGGDSGNSGSGNSDSVRKDPSKFRVQDITADSGYIMIDLCNATAEALGIKGLSVKTASLKTIEEAIKRVSEYRATFGASTNRIEAMKSKNLIVFENLTAAESRIRDTDMASEMSEFNKLQILTQSSTAMIAQANSSHEAVLRLLQ